MRKSEFDIDIAKREGQQKYVTEKEQERMENLYGLSLDRLSAADTARSTARSQFMSGLGQIAGGVAGHYAPGGMGYGQFRQDWTNFRAKQGLHGTKYGINWGDPMSPNPSYDPNSTSSGSIPWGYSPNPSYNPDYTSPSSIPWNY